MRHQLLLGSVAACLFAFATSATAADLDEYTPDWTWYVRGDVGIGINKFGDISQDDLEPGSFESACCGLESMGDSVYLSSGIGMQVNRRFRFDVTGEYRSTADIKAIDYYVSADDPGTGDSTTYITNMEANHTAIVGLVNGYYDITKWRGITPYVGAGVGMAYNSLSGFSGTNDATTVYADNTRDLYHFGLSSDDKSELNLAYAFMAGVSFDIIPNGKLDLGYRYLNLGSNIAASTDIVDCTCGSAHAPLQVKNLAAHEIRVGLRWEFGYGNNEDHSNLKSPY